MVLFNEFKLLFRRECQIIDDTCDAYLAWCKEESKIKKGLLKQIYEKKSIERTKLAKEMSELCQNILKQQTN